MSAVQEIESPPARSNFVSVVAWVFIAIAAFTTFISLLQNILINTVFPVDRMSEITASDAAHAPAFALFMMQHIRAFVLMMLLAAVTMLVASIGLLRRMNWARLIFIALLALGIAWNLGGLILQQVMMSSMTRTMGQVPPDFATEFETMRHVTLVFGAVMALGISFLFGWIIKRLTSAGIRAEFLR